MTMPSLFDDPEVDHDDEEDSEDDYPVTSEDDPPEEPDPVEDDAPDMREEIDADEEEPDSEGDDSEASDRPDPDEGALPPLEDLTPEQRVAVVFDLPQERPEPVLLSELILEYEHWQNPRQFTGLDDEGMKALADDILSKSVTTEDGFIAGILSPLLVVKIKGPNGSIVQLVLDGQRRYKAIEMAAAAANAKGGKRALDIWVKVTDREADPVDWTEALALKYLAEVLGAVGQRQGLSGYELSESAIRLRGTTNPDTGQAYTFAQIAQRIGRSPSWVSKIFGARDKASPKLLARWRRGEITEENFKDLAVGVADKDEQDQAADKITAERQEGDKAAARRQAKEQAVLAKQAKAEAAAKAKADKVAKAKAAQDAKREAKAAKKAVRGPQAELPIAPKAQPAAPSEPDKPGNASKPSRPKRMEFAVIEDVVTEAKKHPPTHDLVKGIVLGLQVASGMMDMEKLPKPWHTYVLHLSGAKPVKKPGKKARRK